MWLTLDLPKPTWPIAYPVLLRLEDCLSAADEQALVPKEAIRVATRCTSLQGAQRYATQRRPASLQGSVLFRLALYTNPGRGQRALRQVRIPAKLIGTWERSVMVRISLRKRRIRSSGVLTEVGVASMATMIES